MFSLFLSSLYSSGLATVMTIPTYEKSISTVDEVVESSLYWVGTHTGWTDSIIKSDDVSKTRTNQKIVIVTVNNRFQVKFDRNRVN